ncbi:MAG TPA: FAD-dependent oxidoreductase [Candidatus Hydrogenedentes bacterium]|nr:FAD-dependent oxidoreductase [Candidatus Hydrogenedentota bacterium]
MSQKHPCNRRDFIRNIGALGALSTYTLAVHVPEIHAEETSFTPPDFDAITKAAGPPADEPNMTSVDLSCDFLVAGGGMAGVCAALAAARNGAKVVLVQNRSRLGGNASSEVRMHIVGANHHKGHPGWREGGILEELRIEDAVRNPHWAWELWDLMLYDKIVSEPNITLLLDASLYRVEMENGAIRRAWVRNDLTEHIYRIQATLYADCTGDCRLGLEAGAAFRTGHEARDQYNESLAPETAGPETMGSSILFTSRDYGYPIPFTPPRWAQKITSDQLRLRKTHSWEYGYWWIEWGGQLDAIRDNEKIRFELLSIVMGVWDYIKNSGNHPDSATWGMNWVGMIPGKRSSRRLIGPHVLIQADLEGKNGDFEDAVAIGGWPFDNHTSGGFYDSDIPPSHSIKIPEVYNIPLRALYSVNVPNLFMAGRNISTSHVALTSTRVMGTCSVEGQAIGTAAALCVKEGILPQALFDNKPLLKAYQQHLLRDDQTIKQLKNEDPADLARKASEVVASGEVESSKAANVLTGFVRDIPEHWDHRWGGPMTSDGAWIELRWKEPQTLSQVQLCFDTGFFRELSLSEQSNVKKGQVRGPQPETVRDYRVLYQAPESDAWVPLVEITGNYERLRRHTFPAITTGALRVHVTATNGSPEARIYEIRCYA